MTEACRHAQKEARTAPEASVRVESEIGNCRRKLKEKKRALEDLERHERASAELEAEKARLEDGFAALGEAIDLGVMAGRLACLKEKLTEAEAAARNAAGRSRSERDA